VTTYIRREAGRYRVAAPDAPQAVRRGDLRFTIDTTDDLMFMRALAGSIREPLGSAGLVAIIAAADRIVAERRVA
jgi:spore coat polysaccharide biosynthesis protein SpsF (cytidylyltransferase family)